MRRDNDPVEGWHWISGEIEKSNYSDEVVWVGGMFLVEFLEQWEENRVNCCYGFAPSPITPSDMANVAHSVVTGVLREKGMIGGHDLVKTFYSHVGEYGCLIVSEAPIEISDALDSSEVQA